uniref:Uncharacterized protein n=1 Tax=Nelumbo nucifera TaxID=4432 RepID=A0A823A038_NELNU|nr:TPA_asm: hypothetical protein HUJ06_019078 [Nelumbo nucifera]
MWLSNCNHKHALLNNIFVGLVL